MNIVSKYAILAAGIALALTSCDENAWNDKLDGFQEPPAYSKLETVNYTLTAADYKTIATNSDNKALAEKDGETAALAAVETNCAFASDEQARKYIPALLANSSFPYFALNNESSVKVTYNLATSLPEEVKAINNTANVLTYKLKDADYQTAWGSEEDFIPAFAPMTPADASLPAILKAALPDAVEGNYAVATYNQAEVNPVFGNVGGGDVSDEPADGVYLDATFADGQGDFVIEDILIPSELTAIWTADSYGYMKATGYYSADKKDFDTEAWLISPEIKLGATTNAVLTFDQVWNYFSSLEVAADQATVHIRETGGQWTRLNIPTVPEAFGWKPWVASGDIDLSAFNGKNVQIGFCYKSTSEKAGTWELKNVRVTVGPKPAKSASRAAATPVPSVQLNAIYHFDGNEWTVPENTVILQSSDYTEMGQAYGNLSGTLPQELLPTYLDRKFPYAADKDAETVVYKYYADGATNFHATQFVKTESKWNPNTGATTDQFTKTGGSWKYNPSVVITLPYVRNSAPTYTYFMECVKWVFENVTLKLYPDSKPADGTKPGPPFIDYRNNAEFYSGASAFYGNVDIRAVTAKNNAPEGYTAYDGLTDDEVTLLIKKRFSTETMPAALRALHSDATPAKDMEVTYTVNFTAYGTSATEESIVYVVSAPGEFTYQSSSWVEKGQDADWK